GCGASIGADPALAPAIAAPATPVADSPARRRPDPAAPTELAPIAKRSSVPPPLPAKNKRRRAARPASQKTPDRMLRQVILGQFGVKKQIGEGGMGAVYLAEQPAMGRNAIIKILRPELSRSRDSASRFDVEARAASQLNHPNIVTIYNYGATD